MRSIRMLTAGLLLTLGTGCPPDGSGWLAVFFDGHVEMLQKNDPRLNNRVNL